MRCRMPAVLAMMAFAVLMFAIPSAAQAGDVCPSYADSEFGGTVKIDTVGDPATVEYTAPDGKLVAGYCVKAGTDPIIIVVDPPAATVTIDYPDKDSVSHYSVWFVNEPEDPICETDESLCPPDPTCETDQSLCPPDPTCETDLSLCPPEEPTCETDATLCEPETPGTPDTPGSPPAPAASEDPVVVGTVIGDPIIHLCFYKRSGAKIKRHGHTFRLKGKHTSHIRWSVDGKRAGKGRKLVVDDFSVSHLVKAKFRYRSCGLGSKLVRKRWSPVEVTLYPQFAG